MMNTVLLATVAGFWLLLTVGLIRARRSWAPMTVVAPLVLLLLGIALNHWVAPWGTIAIGLIHVVLCSILVWMWLTERVRTRHRTRDTRRGDSSP